MLLKSSCKWLLNSSHTFWCSDICSTIYWIISLCCNTCSFTFIMKASTIVWNSSSCAFGRVSYHQIVIFWVDYSAVEVAMASLPPFNCLMFDSACFYTVGTHKKSERLWKSSRLLQNQCSVALRAIPFISWYWYTVRIGTWCCVHIRCKESVGPISIAAMSEACPQPITKCLTSVIGNTWPVITFIKERLGRGRLNVRSFGITRFSCSNTETETRQFV